MSEVAEDQADDAVGGDLRDAEARPGTRPGETADGPPADAPGVRRALARVGSPSAPSRGLKGRAPEEALAARIESDPALDALIDAVEGTNPRAFLRAYRITKRISAAAEAAGVTPQAHYYWLHRQPAGPVPGYPEAFEAINDEVNAYWEELAELRALHGVEEQVYDGDGNLVRQRLRHDPSYLKMVLGGRMPDKYGSAEKRGDTNITVVIERTDE